MSSFLFSFFFLLLNQSFATNKVSSDTNLKTKASTEEITKSILNGTAEPQYKTISKTQYFAGGIFGILPGYGLGHAIQGRWMETGWIFTLAEALMKAGNIIAVGEKGSKNPLVYLGVEWVSWQRDSTKMFFMSFTAYAWMGFKLWEIVDVWWLPSHYKLAQKKSFQVSPVYLYSYNGNIKGTMGLSLKYRW